MAHRFCIVLVAAPPGAPARKIASTILKSRLAACVNILPGATSSFWWKGKIDTAKESLLIMKTRASLFSRLAAAIRSVHPYDVPEIVAVPIGRGHWPYLDWLLRETKR